MATYILLFSSYSSTMKWGMGNLASVSIPHALWNKWEFQMVNACNVDQHYNVQDVEVLDVGLCPRTRWVVKT